jgi:hypothetical protein
MAAPWRQLVRELRPRLRSHSALKWLGVARDLFPLTPLGVAFAVGAYVALRALAYAELDLVWLVTGYAALGLLLLALACVLCSALFVWLKLRKRRTLTHDLLQLETGRVLPTGFALPALRFVPFVQVRWEYLAPDAQRLDLRPVKGQLHEHVALEDRGNHEQIVRRVMVQDPFGLARIAFTGSDLREVVVLPRLDGLSQLPSLNAPAGGSDLPHPMGLEDGDRLELARYTPGDPARFIHWKAFARTRKLLVRRPERAIAVARRCAAFFVAGPNDDASAAVARLALERNLLGREWLFGTDLAVSGTSRVDEALAELRSSVAARELQARGLAGFLSQSDKRGPASVIVFGPPEPGAWIAAVTRAASRRQLQVVMAVDGIADTLAPPRWLGLFRRESPLAGARAAALEEVLLTLGRARIPVVLLDRKTGRALGAQGIRALTRAAAPAASGSRVAARGSAA